jgi:DNA gyrase subunit A
MARFKLSEVQAQAILDMPLRRLAALERMKLEEERKELTDRVKKLKEILSSEERRLAVVADETNDIKARFADRRRTVIVDAEEGHQARVTVADLVVPTEPQLVLVTQTGVLRVNAKGYRDSTATRNKATARAVEFPIARIQVEPEQVVALITNKGRLWKSNAGRIGLQISFSQFGLAKDERIIGLGLVRPGQKVVMLTRGGSVKRVNTEDLNGRTEGNWAQVIGLEDNDEVVVAGIGTDSAHLIIATSGTDTATPRALRIETKSVNPQATPNAKGVAAIKMGEDPIIGGALIEPDCMKGFALFVTDKGQVKRITLNEFPVQGRGGQGVQTWKLTKATGLITGFAVVPSAAADADLYSERGRRLRLAVKDIPAVTRAAKGVDLKTIIKGSDIFGAEPVAGIVAG